MATDKATDRVERKAVEPMDVELLAMKRINRILGNLRPAQQERVLQWAAGKATEAAHRIVAVPFQAQ
jgi:hypothetical protein